MTSVHPSAEIEKRRIFGIISHPDAGKTTLTEKLLLHGGAIREAGTVKARRSSKFATSDWMEIEKQRGISVTSSVMQFHYRGKVISIMDTPGHNDFGEDTYRILTSVDSAVMVIDGAKGVEDQTRKLFAACRLRGIPIFTFVNKLDRETKDPLELLSELEEVLGMPAAAVTWPVGSGLNFQGVYDLLTHRLHLYREHRSMDLTEYGPGDPSLDSVLAGYNLKKFREEMDLLKGAGNPLDLAKVGSGDLTPVFFGSALADFGVTEFLHHFLDMSPPPQPRQSSSGWIRPADPDFSGYIFKIQANMNPAHRDRLAFLRVCSGTFERGMTAVLTRTGKPVKLTQSIHLMANERNQADTAVAGDVIGIYDTGTYQIGDTLTTAKEPFAFDPLPTFPPELFALVQPRDTMKAKQFHKGVRQLAQEGAIQVYRNAYNEVILGAVGQLQFEVFQYRVENEYNAPLRMTPLDYTLARWIPKEQEEKLKACLDARSMLVYDRFERPLILFANAFTLRYFKERFPFAKLMESLEISEDTL